MKYNRLFYMYASRHASFGLRLVVARENQQTTRFGISLPAPDRNSRDLCHLTSTRYASSATFYAASFHHSRLPALFVGAQHILKINNDTPFILK